MQVQVNSDATITGDERTVEVVTASVEGILGRFGAKLTRVEVFLTDENGGQKQGGADKVCRVEARPAGLAPLTVTHKASEVIESLDGALEKMERMLDHHFGKLDKTKGNTSMAGDQQGF